MKDTGSYIRQTDTCPDCIARDDVDLLGRPRPGKWGRIRHCLGCKGSARIQRERPNVSLWPGSSS